MSDYSLSNTLYATPTVTLDGQPNLLETYKQGNGYEYDSGLIALPVAGPDGTPPRVVKLYAAIGRRTVSVSATKTDTPPLIPRIGDDSPEGDIFLNGSLSLPLPQINSQQTGFNYHADASYNYIQAAAPRGYSAYDTFQTGSYPFNLPLINTLASSNPLTTVGSSSNPFASVLQTNQTPLNGVSSPDCQWLSTTWLPAFFIDLDQGPLLPTAGDLPDGQVNP